MTELLQSLESDINWQAINCLLGIALLLTLVFGKRVIGKIPFNLSDEDDDGQHRTKELSFSKRDMAEMRRFMDDV